MSDPVVAHSLRDLHASGATVVRIIGTNALCEGHWLTYTVSLTSDGEYRQGLYCRKSDVALASDLWPSAEIGTLANDWLIAVQ